MKEAEYRGYLIYWSVEKPGGTEFWNARGWIEFYQSQTLCSLNSIGSVNKFTSENDAEHHFLTEAKNWIEGPNIAESRKGMCLTIRPDGDSTGPHQKRNVTLSPRCVDNFHSSASYSSEAVEQIQAGEDHLVLGHVSRTTEGR
jgi:hypothetical protein